MEKTFSIFFRKSAEKQMLSLPKIIGFRIIEMIESLRKNPYPVNSKRLTVHSNIYRLRMADYRIIYRIEKNQLIIEIIKVGHRQNIYK